MATRSKKSTRAAVSDSTVARSRFATRTPAAGGAQRRLDERDRDVLRELGTLALWISRGHVSASLNALEVIADREWLEDDELDALNCMGRHLGELIARRRAAEDQTSATPLPARLLRFPNRRSSTP